MNATKIKVGDVVQYAGHAMKITAAYRSGVYSGRLISIDGAADGMLVNNIRAARLTAVAA